VGCTEVKDLTGCVARSNSLLNGSLLWEASFFVSLKTYSNELRTSLAHTRRSGGRLAREIRAQVSRIAGALGGRLAQETRARERGGVSLVVRLCMYL
jgi:hypothetical protein